MDVSVDENKSVLWKKKELCKHDVSMHIKKQRHYFTNKGPSSQSYGFSSSHVWMESWTIKKAECQRIDAFKVVLEKTLERESLGLQGDPAILF